MRRPSAVTAAAILGALYGVVAAGVATVLLVQQGTGRGPIGAEQLTGRGAKGLIEFAIFLFGVGILLVFGAVRLIRAGNGTLLYVPLTIFLVLGTIGEVVDIVGSASAMSDLIGCGVLILAALPVALIFAPSARGFSRAATAPSDSRAARGEWRG